MPGTMTGPDANEFIFAEAADDDNVYYDSLLAPNTDIEDDKVGQLALVPVKHLDFESSKNSYHIEFSEGDADSEVIRVTILVTDVNEAPSVPAQARGGLQITGPSNIPSYNEDRTDAVGYYATTGAGTSATVTWSLSGDDTDDLNINADGMLAFNAVPDYEMPTDANGDNIYSITVEADDGSNQDSQFVTITVGNIREDGVVTLSTDMPSAGGAVTATLDDPDGMVMNIMWQWSRAEMAEGPYTDIRGADKDTYTPLAAVPDDPATMDDETDARDEGMFLRATATYEDGYGRGQTAMENTAAAVGVIPDNEGTVNLSSGQPVIGTPLTAILSDGDTPILMEEWQWASSDAMDGTFTDITGATTASYTPREAMADDPATTGDDETYAGDVGMYLRATVMYDDSHGADKSAMMVTANPVIVAPVDPCIAPLGSLTAPETRMGTWASDCPSNAQSGSYARYYTFTLVRDMQVEMNLTSGTDPYLVLREGEGRTGRLVTSNDNVGSRNLNSSINRMLVAGTYTVEATTFFAGQTGDFTLSVRPLQETEDLGMLTRSVDRSNSMWVSDYMSTQQEGSYARSYTFTLDAATHVVINLTAPEDPYLFLLGSDGTTVVHESDNITTRNLNSKIDETLQPGTYTIEATTYFPGRMGTFHLSIGVIP